MAKMNPVVHFEMPATDKQKVIDFYSKVFGWHMQMTGPEMNNYVVVTTTEVDKEKGRPKEPGAINGGIYDRDKSNPKDAPSFVIAVDDIKAHVKMIADAGGKIIHGPDDIPGVGTFASFLDPDGNRNSVLQPAPMMDIHPK